MKVSRSTAASSSTSRAGWPSAGSSTNAFSTRTGPAVSITMREPPGHHQAEAKRLDETPPLLAGARRKLKRHLREIDHDAKRVAEREGADVDLAGQVNHKAGMLGVARDTGIGRDRIALGGLDIRRGNDALLRKSPGRPPPGRKRPEPRLRIHAWRANRSTGFGLPFPDPRPAT